MLKKVSSELNRVENKNCKTLKNLGRKLHHNFVVSRKVPHLISFYELLVKMQFYVYLTPPYFLVGCVPDGS